MIIGICGCAFVPNLLDINKWWEDLSTTDNNVIVVGKSVMRIEE